MTSEYNNSFFKRFLDVFLSFLFLILSLPIWLLISLIILFTSGSPVFFLQKRTGKNGKIFEIIKFRTMKLGSEKIQNKYRKLNESDGPVFKIINDPRFTQFGKLLSRTGLDELPQFINVLKGEMSLIGPRPLPINEYEKLTKHQKSRNLITPGITSPWVINGSHEISFKKWMELDLDYVKNASFKGDLLIFAGTLYIMIRSILKLIFIK